MTDAKINHLRDYIQQLDFEIGFPCIHREQKNYINNDNLLTWDQVFNDYLVFPCQYPDNVSEDSSEDSNHEDSNASSDKYYDKFDSDEESNNDMQSDNANNEFVNSIDNESDKDMQCTVSKRKSVEQLDNKGYIVKRIVVKKHSILSETLKALTKKEKNIFMLSKITAFSTWMKYKKICHPHVRLQILKEDCCDTCAKYELMLEDNVLSEKEKEDVREALSVSKIAHTTNVHLYYALKQCRLNNDS